MDLDWFCDILALDLKGIWTNLLDSVLFYDRAGMLLEKSQKLLELSLNQLKI